eukprot:7036483-Lingulodinium_polyedra.AAC.1
MRVDDVDRQPLEGIRVEEANAVPQGSKHLPQITEVCVARRVDLPHAPLEAIVCCMAATLGAHDPVFQKEVLRVKAILPLACCPLCGFGQMVLPHATNQEG